MKMFRKFWGSWPQWYGELDGGDIVYVRIRHGDVSIGTGATEEAAMDSAECIKENILNYQGVTDTVEALSELREKGYYFVPSSRRV